MTLHEMTERMKELIRILNEASKAYYAQDKEIMSDYDYDKLYDELVSLEEQSNIVLAGSPTVTVGYEAVDALPKEAHEKPMLSLGKTKEREELKNWLGNQVGLLSWKMDGLTIVLTYENGMLTKGVTRGNGEIGEVITPNIKAFKNVPLRISFPGKLIVRGEAVITYEDFEMVNASLQKGEEPYKNPRNLCSGSVRQLDSSITAQRNVRFYAFSLVEAKDKDFDNSMENQFLFLKEQGFDIVEYKKVTADTILDTIDYFEHAITEESIPSDGLVLSYNDIAYGLSLGRTAKFPRNAIAFKWADELKETVLTQIEWSPSRTGLINPVAIFEPVELEGTTVSRASLHNISIMEGLQLGLGDHITVYKANMIIPQIAENLTKSNTFEIPKICPVCGGATAIRQQIDTKSLYCSNPNCQAKKLKSFSHFVSRDAMNVDGLSEMTLEKFIGRGFIHNFADIFHLDNHKDAIVAMDGFGLKSYENLWESIQKSRQVELPKFIYALGIPGIGLANAKVMCRYFHNDFDELMQASVEEMSEIEGIGGVLATSVYQFFRDKEALEEMQAVRREVTFMKKEGSQKQNLQGMSFVVTGSLIHYANRNDLKEEIENRGGKVTGSVTGKTICLINNDSTSGSSKNKKAKELGIPILTEEEFLQQYFI